MPTSELIDDTVLTAQANRLLLIALIGYMYGTMMTDIDSLRNELPTGVADDLVGGNPEWASLINRAILDAHAVLDGIEEDTEESDPDDDRLVHLYPDLDDLPEPANDR